jgi:mRNA-degrading endonuclease RelE of RelBE toxin-antitoxin system
VGSHSLVLHAAPHSSHGSSFFIKLQEKKKQKGRPEYRIREGVYRVIYDIHDDVLNVLIVKVGHRKDIY